ncbi:MAG: right-handed parallel beta-helix repeat-containing protein [Wenzhouxiangella sp.]
MTIFSVSNSEELLKALASAKGGDTIELAGGDYGRLSLVDGKTDFNIRFDTPVTITSADPDAPASFSEMGLNGARNITFDNIVFDYEFSIDDSPTHRPFQVNNSENITIRDSVFLGDVAEGISDVRDGFGYAYGLSVRHGENIVIENNVFTSWALGAGFSDIEGLTVSQNEFHDIQRDGTNFSEVRSVLIEDNHFHNFRDHEDSTAHRDFIQFHSSGKDQPSTDIVIRGNILDIGEGSRTQSIFMRNEQVDTGRAGEEMFYRNILIEDNVIHNGHLHGITVGETDGLIIRNNSVLHAEGEMHGAEGSVTIPRINVKPESTSVVIEGNITSAIRGYENQLSWTVDGNAIIQPGDYLEAFVTSSLDPVVGAHNFIALPGGLIEILQAGAARTQFDVAPDTLTPLFQVHSDASSSHALILDASLTVGPVGLVSESDVDFLWNFGDGSTATGWIVKHEFASPGHHDVTLTVVAKDGTTAQAQFTAGIAGDDILQFNAQAGLFEAFGYGEETALDGSGLPLQKTAEGYFLKLGGEGTQASVVASELSNFFGTDSFEMSMTLKADSAASWGEVARVHSSFVTSVDQDGNFRLELSPDDGSRVRLISDGIALNDGAAHDVTIRFDGKAGFAEILIDGLVVASEAVSGSLGGGLRSLDFGNPWGKQNFDGELSAFALSASSRDFPIYDGAALPVSGTETGMTEEGTISPDPVKAEDEIAPEDNPVVDSGETEASEPTETEDNSTFPESDPAPAEPEVEPAPEEESGLPKPVLNGGYKLDFASVMTSDTVKLHDDAHVTETGDGLALIFDGKKDYASLGRLTEFETSQKLAFSVDFVNESSGGAERLVWNHQKIGLTLEGDGLRVHVGNNDGKFHQGFQIEGLGLNDGNRHTATVMVDAETDRLQVVVNDVLVLDKQGTDFDFVGAGGHEWGWSLGTAWNRWFEGEVHGFQVSDDFTFIEPVAEDGTVLG